MTLPTLLRLFATAGIAAFIAAWCLEGGGPDGWAYNASFLAGLLIVLAPVVYGFVVGKPWALVVSFVPLAVWAPQGGLGVWFGLVGIPYVATLIGVGLVLRAAVGWFLRRRERRTGRWLPSPRSGH